MVAMSYDVGQHIDLSYINRKKPAEVPSRQKKSRSAEAARTLYDVGTQFVFRLTPAGFQAAIKIPVAFA